MLNCFQQLFLETKVMSSRYFVQIVFHKCTTLSDITPISSLTNNSDGTMHSRGSAFEVQQCTFIPIKYNIILSSIIFTYTDEN